MGGLWTAASTLFPFIYTTVISIVAAHVLGPDDMGRQSFISFVVLTVQVVSTSGLGYSLVRYTGDLIGRGEEARVRGLVRFGWQLAAPISLVAAAALLLIAVGGAEPRGAWVFGAVAVFAGSLNNIPMRILVGAQHWREQSVVSLVTGALSVGATLVVLELGGGITGMLGVVAGASLLVLVWSRLLMRRLLTTFPSSDAELGVPKQDVVRFAGANYVPVLLNFVVLQRSEFFFLDHYSTDTQIALYSIAFSTLLALRALPMSVRMIVMPSVATLAAAGEFDRIRRGFSRFVRMSILVTIPLTAGALVLGPTLLRLVYGQQYEGAGEVLLVLVGPLPLVPISAAAGALLTGYGRVLAPTVIAGLAAAVDIAAATILVPRFDAVGAALANDLALLASGLPMLPYCYRILGGIDMSWAHVVRITVVSALAAAVARLVLELGGGPEIFVAAVVLGIVSFALLAVRIKLVPMADAEWIAGIAQERGASRVTRAARLVAS
jgi:O-antigen/teichoic acid export membrane protein